MPRNFTDDDAEPGALKQARMSAAACERPSQESNGSLRTNLANAMVTLKKKYYGRGPTAAKAWILDDYVFVALEGGLTRNEETMLADGKENEVRRFRLSFQETVSGPAMNAVSELTGRTVIGYHSQIVFRPTRIFEIFVLEQPPDNR